MPASLYEESGVANHANRSPRHPVMFTREQMLPETRSGCFCVINEEAEAQRE